MKPSLSIVVPCYNESKNLDRLLDAFRDVVSQRTDVELVLVDNGSIDSTPERLAQLLSQPANRFARCVRVDVNQGYGHGIKYGLERTEAEIVGWTHADLQTPPSDVLRAFDMLKNLPDTTNAMVRGLRQGRPFLDQIFTSGMGWFATVALKSPLFDVNAQPKLFHRSLLNHFGSAPDDFTLDLYLLHLANRLGVGITTFDVRFEERLEGESKGGGSLTGKYRLSRRTFQQILKLRSSLKDSFVPQGLNEPESTYQQTSRERKVA